MDVKNNHLRDLSVREKKKKKSLHPPVPSPCCILTIYSRKEHNTFHFKSFFYIYYRRTSCNSFAAISVFKLYHYYCQLIFTNKYHSTVSLTVTTIQIAKTDESTKMQTTFNP